MLGEVLRRRGIGTRQLRERLLGSATGGFSTEEIAERKNLRKDSLRLCTWNIKHGEQLETVINVIKQNPHDFAGLDFMLLQEASKDENDVENARVIAEALNSLGGNYEYVQLSTNTLNGKEQANAIIWNTKRIKKTVEPIQVDLPTILEGGASRIEKAMYGPRIFTKQQRHSIMFEGTFTSSGEESCATTGDKVRLYNVHYHIHGLGPHRASEAATVFGHNTQREKETDGETDIVLVVGDHNTFSPYWWKALNYEIKRHDFKDATKKAGRTGAGKIPGQHLDKVLHMQNQTDVATRIVRYAGSDHYPVFAYVWKKQKVLS